MELGDGVFEVKATRGDNFLGGEDFDLQLVERLAVGFEHDTGIDLMQDPVALQRLKEAAEAAKIELSFQDFSEIDLPFIATDKSAAKHLKMSISRNDFEELIHDEVERSIGICKAALKDAGLSPGSTRIPLIERELHSYFGNKPYGGLRREDAVALGAAIQAGVFSGDVKDVFLLDCLPMSVGIESLGGVFTPMIDRNTTLPTKRSQVFSTAEDNQEAVSIRVFQGGGRRSP